MFDTGVRQLRMAMAMVSGRRVNPRNLERLVADARATLVEFGQPGADTQSLLDGPLTDPAARHHHATTNLRRTARRLAHTSAFYARRFDAAGVDPHRLTLVGLSQVPVTVKRDLIDRAEAFRCHDVDRFLATRTTGTTGQPAEVWLSRYEVELWAALGALAALLRDDVRPTDTLQVNVSSRASATVTLDVAACRLIGAGCRLLGMVPVEEALDSLCGGQITLLSTTPSYLGLLLTAARRRGLTERDFRLRRIDVGGEILSTSLERAARSTFGVPLVNDLFGMTEVLPVTGRTCSHGHLHHDLNTGHVEYLDLRTAAPAAPGALATVVITPYFPYRDCMPVFRYDTRDVVRPLDHDGLTCEVAGLPACSKVLGKADQLVELGGGRTVTPRQVVEAVEALPNSAWPARFRIASADRQLRLTLPESVLNGLSRADVIGHLAGHGLDVELDLVPDRDATKLRTLRCDLHETTFTTRSAAGIGA